MVLTSGNMAKRDEEEAVKAVAVGNSIRGYANRKLELSTGVWSVVDSDLQRAGDVSACR